MQLILGRPHLLDNFHRLDADASDPPEEINHLLLVGRKSVSVECLPNGRVLWRLFLVLIENSRPVRADRPLRHVSGNAGTQDSYHMWLIKAAPTIAPQTAADA